MDIYVVQPGDTIYSIAEKYGVSIYKLVQENGLINPFNIVTGQTIVITYPSQIHTVQEGDTVTSIANEYGITLMQLLRNNAFLDDRTYLFPGETIIISYDTNGTVMTNGYAYPYINLDALRKTLRYLTYVSVFNYRVTKEGEIVAYGGDAEIIQLAKYYGVAPLLMISTLTPKGEAIPEIIYEILLNEDFQDRLLNNIIDIIKSSGYLGINVLFSNLNETTQNLYINYLIKVSDRFKSEGLLLFITINPNIKYVDNEITFEQIDYSNISQMVDGIIFLQYEWGVNYNPPSPVSSISLLRNFINYVVGTTSPDSIIIGMPLIGYDWELPYIPNSSFAHSLTIDSAIALAGDVGVPIQFDETSQTPFFQYYTSFVGAPIEHIVWFIDARSINALDELIIEYDLSGSGVWNIMIYNQQLWTIINSRFEIIKVLPDNLNSMV